MEKKNTRIRNLQYGAKTRLIRGIYPALNWEWKFRIGSRGLEFGVMFSNSEWRFGIRSGVFKLGVMFSNLG